MPIRLSLRRVLAWTFSVAAALLLIMAMAITTALDAGYFRPLLLGLFAADIGRAIQLDGSLQSHIPSPHIGNSSPMGVTIGNPSWMPAGVTARIDRLTLHLGIPGEGHWWRVDQLLLEGASLFLVRDADGRANWQLRSADKGASRATADSAALSLTGLPTLRSMTSGGICEVSKAQFIGVGLPDGAGGPASLRIKGAGQLNGAATSLAWGCHRRSAGERQSRSTSSLLFR